MKKIGIITIVRTNNYGAELQAFALQQKLALLGYKTEVIDFLYFKHRNHKRSKGSDPIVKKRFPSRIKEHILYRIVSPLVEMLMPIFHHKTKDRIRNFRAFRENNISFSKTYRSQRELYSAKLNYDIFMVGSDQVWNPFSGTSLSPYFLTFAPKDARKISYGSSFGVSEIDDLYKDKYNQYLNNLDKISVREKQAVKLVRKLSERDSTWVLDPTLLLTKEEWSQFELPSKTTDPQIILLYQLTSSETIVELAQKIHKKTGLPVKRICKRSFLHKKDPNIENILDVGPAQFLSLYSKAVFVVTNSFHGTAFSVNFTVPFFSVISKARNNNSRIESFLELVRLENRIVYEGTEIENIDIESPLDFTEVQSKLNYERAASVNFLLKSIESEC